MEGRLYYVEIRVTYSGGRLPDEDRAAFLNALSPGSQNILVTVDEQLYSVVVLSARLRADNPLNAITAFSKHVDRALFATGLVERFDITGKILKVWPAHDGQER